MKINWKDFGISILILALTSVLFLSGYNYTNKSEEGIATAIVYSIETLGIGMPSDIMIFLIAPSLDQFKYGELFQSMMTLIVGLGISLFIYMDGNRHANFEEVGVVAFLSPLAFFSAAYLFLVLIRIVILSDFISIFTFYVMLLPYYILVCIKLTIFGLVLKYLLDKFYFNKVLEKPKESKNS